MSEFFGFLIIVAIAAIAIHLIIKHKNKKNKTTPRVPYRIDSNSPRQSLSISSHSSRQPFSISSHSSRQPMPITNHSVISQMNEDRNYLSFRNCPDCHSENAVNHHVIHKIGSNSFVCTVCGHRFKI